mmetsp:Transcript_64577/g.187131  ORF Transcript_64577/g.187131 Transcript_64577/m.187131 type:complete len:215 (-) Transcript_64577:854-1498(-)
MCPAQRQGSGCAMSTGGKRRRARRSPCTCGSPTPGGWPLRSLPPARSGIRTSPSPSAQSWPKAARGSALSRAPASGNGRTSHPGPPPAARRHPPSPARSGSVSALPASPPPRTPGRSRGLGRTLGPCPARRAASAAIGRRRAAPPQPHGDLHDAAPTSAAKPGPLSSKAPRPDRKSDEPAARSRAKPRPRRRRCHWRHPRRPRPDRACQQKRWQ